MAGAELPAAELPVAELPVAELSAAELLAAELSAAELSAAKLPAASDSSGGDAERDRGRDLPPLRPLRGDHRRPGSTLGTQPGGAGGGELRMEELAVTAAAKVSEA